VFNSVAIVAGVVEEESRQKSKSVGEVVRAFKENKG
jgi:hypothetical protein